MLTIIRLVQHQVNTMFPISTSRITTILILGTLLVTEFVTVWAQKLDTDSIDFTELSGFSDQRQCVRDCFGDCPSCYSIQVAKDVGCETNKCLCSKDTTFQMALEDAVECVKPCETVEDTKAAKQILIDYCAMHKYHPSTEPVDAPTSSAEESAGASADPTSSSDDELPAMVTASASPTDTAAEDGTTLDKPKKIPSKTGTRGDAKGTVTPSSGAGPNIPRAQYELTIVWATLALGLPWIFTQVWL